MDSANVPRWNLEQDFDLALARVGQSVMTVSPVILALVMVAFEDTSEDVTFMISVCGNPCVINRPVLANAEGCTRVICFDWRFVLLVLLLVAA